MDILLSSDMPVKVLGDLRNLGIQAEIDTGASLEKSVLRARREQSILMVPVQTTDFQPEVLRRAPGVIALGKKRLIVQVWPSRWRRSCADFILNNI